MREREEDVSLLTGAFRDWGVGEASGDASHSTRKNTTKAIGVE